MTRHPVLTILMALAGIILLLPGVCAAGFIIAGGLPAHNVSSLYSLWAICFLIAAGGALLLYKTFHKPAPKP
jgi:hypothetical protein